MKIEEVAALEPLAALSEAYELNPGARYVFVFGGDLVLTQEDVARMYERLGEIGLSKVFLLFAPDLKVFELKGDAEASDAERC